MKLTLIKIKSGLEGSKERVFANRPYEITEAFKLCNELSRKEGLEPYYDPDNNWKVKNPYGYRMATPKEDAEIEEAITSYKYKILKVLEIVSDTFTTNYKKQSILISWKLWWNNLR
jgi:hypothetical protein